MRQSQREMKNKKIKQTNNRNISKIHFNVFVSNEHELRFCFQNVYININS